LQGWEFEDFFEEVSGANPAAVVEVRLRSNRLETR
jgi:hypothetical protein